MLTTRVCVHGALFCRCRGYGTVSHVECSTGSYHGHTGSFQGGQSAYCCPVFETHPIYGLLRLERRCGQRNGRTPKNVGNRASATFSVSHGRVGTAQNAFERSVYYHKSCRISTDRAPRLLYRLPRPVRCWCIGVRADSLGLEQARRADVHWWRPRGGASFSARLTRAKGVWVARVFFLLSSSGVH